MTAYFMVSLRAPALPSRCQTCCWVAKRQRRAGRPLSAWPRPCVLFTRCQSAASADARWHWLSRWHVWCTPVAPHRSRLQERRHEQLLCTPCRSELLVVSKAASPHGCTSFCFSCTGARARGAVRVGQGPGGAEGSGGGAAQAEDGHLHGHGGGRQHAAAAGGRTAGGCVPCAPHPCRSPNPCTRTNIRALKSIIPPLLSSGTLNGSQCILWHPHYKDS